jgi:hypothetical protein
VETGRWERAKLACLRFSHGQTAAVLTLSLGPPQPDDRPVPISVTLAAAAFAAFSVACFFISAYQDLPAEAVTTLYFCAKLRKFE